MKLRHLILDQFRKFDTPVQVGPLSDGLNLIAGPNEMGKSTLLAAIRAAMFARHNSKAETIKSFKPFAMEGAAPFVALDFELGGKPYKIEKRFLKQAFASLTLPDGRRVQGKEAEDELQDLLGLGRDDVAKTEAVSPGHFAAVFAAQRQSFDQPPLSAGARGSLQASIAKEVESLGGGEMMAALMTTLDTHLHDTKHGLIDRRGKPKNGYKSAIETIASIDAQIEDLARKQAELKQDLQAFAEAERRLAALDREAGEAQSDDRIAKAEAELDRAIKKDRALREVEAAKRRLRDLESARDRHQKHVGAKKTADAEIEMVRSEIDLAQRHLDASKDQAEQLEGEIRASTDSIKALDRRRRLFEDLQRAMEQRARIEAALDAASTEVSLDLLPEAEDRVEVHLDDHAVEIEPILQVAGKLRIKIEGIGELGIRPKLAKLRAMRDEQQACAAEIATLLAQLELPTAELEPIEAAYADHREELAAFERKRDEHAQDFAALKTAIRDDEGRLQRLEDRRAEIERRLAELTSALAEEAKVEAHAFDGARQELRHLEEVLARFPFDDGSAASIDAIRAHSKKLRERKESLDRDRHAAKLSLETLASRIRVRAGDGLGEQLDEARRRRERHANERDGLKHKVDALSLLRETLQSAERDVKAKFLGPLVDRLNPHIGALFPGALIALDPEYRITAIHRSPAIEEPFEALSDGTREQISVLTRLAFAEMLQDQGLPVVLVLDDALVFADDDRLTRLFEILENASTTLQTLVLTCREERFGGLNASRLAIVDAQEERPRRHAASS